MRNDHDWQRASTGRLRSITGAAAALGLALALGGCAVGPKFERPDVTMNPAWSGGAQPGFATAAPADTAWWRAFSDPTLDSLVEIACRQNLPLQVAGLRILEARAQLGIAVGRQWPQIQTLVGNATAVGLSENSATGFASDRYFANYELGFDAAWEADFWGRYRSDVRAQDLSLLATVADYDNALVSLTAEVARVYAVIRTFEVLIDQARQNAALQEEGLQIAQSRFRNGATSELDVSQATTLFESTRATIPQLEAGRIQAENALCTLLGQPTGTLTARLQGGTGIPTAPANVAVSVPAELLRRRPDVRAVELSAAAQCARIGVAKSDLYPSFTLFGTIGFQSSSGVGSLNGQQPSSNLFDAGSLFYSFGPRLFWPVFNYGRIRNNIRVQDARLQQLLVDYENTVLRAAQEVEDGMTGFRKAQEATAFQENAARGAQRSVELAMVQYREGAVDFQRVLDAQRSLLQEENTLARTRSSIATDLIALYKALGGGWELRQGQPVVPDATRIQMQGRTNWGDYFSKPAPSTTNGASPNSR